MDPVTVKAFARLAISPPVETVTFSTPIVAVAGTDNLRRCGGRGESQ